MVLIASAYILTVKEPAMSCKKILMPIFALVLYLPLIAQDILPGTRDPWQWPFARTSIWNMPIGSNAQYKDANFEAAGHIGVDIQHIVALDKSDPKRQAFLSTSFGPGRCSGTESINLWLPIPDNWLVPDAGNSPYGNTPNSNFALRLQAASADTVFEGCRIARCEKAGPFYIPD